MIQIRNLSKIYENSRGERAEVLKNIDLTIEDGDIYGIVGLSGAGKSTLVRCINLLERPTSGAVYLNGEDVTKVSSSRLRVLRRRVAMIFQQFNLLSQRTVLQNVELAGELYGDKNRTRKAAELLKSVGLGDKLSAYPSQLSGGQQQRVAVARALMSEPEVLLCDEPTSALDPDTARSVLSLLKRLNEELRLTVVIISHQMSVIEAVCNKAAILSGAGIEAQGDLRDVFLSPRSAVAKRLIYAGKIDAAAKGETLVKLMFEGDTEAPVITNIIRDCNVSLSVFYAETKRIAGRVYGQAMFRLQNYAEEIAKLRAYLKKTGVRYEEVTTDELF
ncbi:MAG: methionine ABC transporter ATP-binding protein [Christensenellaceae bacterium]|nr:methionine ABC transporter ATP-binding protein [Bacillota bacterium]